MKKILLIVASVVVLALAFFGCATQGVIESVYNSFIASVLRSPVTKYQELDKGVELQVVTTQPNEKITKSGSTVDKVVYHLSGKRIFDVPIADYVRTMGLVEKSPLTDYKLFITILRADVNTANATIELKVNLIDSNNKEVYSQNSISATATGNMLPNYNKTVSKALNEALTQALEQINWNRIASFLRTEQLPKEEPQKQVQGYGDTALENTIIRWDVQSRPQGADIFWRVVSKTPEVKSTNNKYLMTTPYEATKSLDIRGLTYQTAGDVRIILRCEKDGYMPQEKEYNVRMIIDQEEISAFFRLVKEEE